MKKLSKPRYRIVGDMTRFDERENVHARYELEPDTPAWETFYQKHPEWEKVDLETKALPGIGKVGHPWDLPMLASQVQILSMLGRENMVDGPVSPDKKEIDPGRAAEKIRGLAHHLGADLVREMGASEAMAHAILSHNERHGIAREANLDKALFCADPLTGLITAAALVRLDKKLAGVEAKSVKKRFKEKSFAAGVNREHISQCSELGLELDEFVELGLEAMKGMSSQIRLN